MRLVTKIFSNMLVFSRAKMRLVVSQPKKRKKYEIGYLKKLIWYGKIWTFLEGSSLNIFVLHTWLHSFWCLTFQLFKFSLHSPDLLLHLTSFTFFHSHGLSSHHSVLCFPFFFSFIMLTLISYFIFFFVYFSSMNDLLVHVTNFVVLWFSSLSLSFSLSQNSWEWGKNTRYSAMSNSSLQYYFWPEWQNFAQNAGLIQNRPEFGMTQNMGSPAPVCPLERKIPAIPART